MTDERKLAPEPSKEDDHKQPTADHTDTTSSSSSSSSPSSSSSSTTPSSSAAPSELSSGAAAIERLLEKDVTKAEAAKAEGNTHFAHKQFEAAIQSYTHAILLCPNPAPSSSPSSPAAAADEQSAALTGLLATLHSNRAAAHLNLGQYPQTITECSQSISLQPTVKAHLRRSIAYEKDDKYAEAIDDIKAAIAMGGLDGKGSGVREEEERLRRLEGKRKEKEEAMKTEMLGKLKDLGNGLLGKFGMSLDNFKAVKDPNTGSYSISFGK